MEHELIKRRNPANKVIFIASNAFHVDSKDTGTASYGLHVKTEISTTFSNCSNVLNVDFELIT